MIISSISTSYTTASVYVIRHFVKLSPCTKRLILLNSFKEFMCNACGVSRPFLIEDLHIRIRIIILRSDWMLDLLF